MFNKIRLIDSLVRIAIFTLFCFWLTRVYTNFEYSLVSYILFAITLTAVALPRREVVAVFILTIFLNTFFKHLFPEKIFVLDAALRYKNVILSKILLYTSIIPILIFIFIKKITYTGEHMIKTIIGITASWLIYSITVPFIYAVTTQTTTDIVYMPLFRYLFVKNIIIHILLGIIICIIGTFIWQITDLRNSRISKNKIK